MTKARFLQTVLVFALLVSTSVLTFAQEGTSRLSGTVTDTNGSIIEGAKVSVSNEATGVKFTQVTTSGGLFTFASLFPGNYAVTVEQSGFKKNVRTNNAVQVNTPLNVDIVLEPGNVTEVVTVQAEGITVQPNTATIGNVVDQRTIETLPLNGRNPLTLVLLEPGVVQRSFGGAGSGVHINGSRDRAFNVTIDGIDANESTVPNPVSNLYRLNPDNVQEFKVTTNNATAEEGRNSGASIGLSTKSGTNSFHGTAFIYYRNDKLNSTEWFANALKQPKRDTDLQQFGFEMGGPVILPFGEGKNVYNGKNKTFFFGSWQQNRVDFSQPIDQTFGVPSVLTATARSGIFRYWVPDLANPLVISGTTILRNSPLLVNSSTGELRTDLGVVPCATPASVRCVRTYSIAGNIPAGVALDGSVASYLSTLPGPNAFGFGDGLNTAGYLWNPPTAIRGPAYQVRIDHNFNSDHSIFGRYLYSDYNTLKGDPLNGRPQVFPGFPPQGEVFRKTSNFVTGWKWTVSPYITNDFRFGYSRFKFTFTQGTANPAFPNVSSVDYNLISEPYINTAQTEREIFTPQFIDNMTIVKGNHVIGLGMNMRFYRHQDNRSLGGPTVLLTAAGTANSRALFPAWNAAPNINTGTTSDNTNLQNYLANMIGHVYRIQQTFVADFANDVFLPYLTNGKPNLFNGLTKANQYNFYLQDEWRVRSNLTINAGVRWEINPPAYTAGGKTFVPNGDVFAGNVTFVKAAGWYKIDKWKYLGPSLGLVWGPSYKSGLLKSMFGESGKSAIRIGYRIAFDPISTFQVTSAASRVPGLTQVCTTTLVNQAGPPATVVATPTGGCPAAPVQTLGGGFPQFLQPPTNRPSAAFTPSSLTIGSAPGITLFAPNMKLPEVHQWSLSWQRELPWKMVMQAAYVGRRGTHLYYAGNRNQASGRSILDSFLLMQQNMRNSCLPSGTGNLPGGTCTNPVTSIPLLAAGTGITAATVDAAGAQSEILGNALGSLASRIENTSTNNLRLRPSKQFGVITYIDNAGDSMYHAAQFSLRRRFAQGFGLSAAYTFAKSMDNQSVDPVGAASGGGLSTTNSRTPVDMQNLRDEWARSDFDRTHVFNLTTVWELPVGRGQRFLGSAPGWVNHFIGGWTLNSIQTFMTGEPFSVRSNVFTNNSGHDSRAAILDPNVRAQLTFPTNIAGPVVFPNSAGFTIPAPGSNGAGRNIFVAPSYYNLDIGIIKQISITERFKLDFRTEFFNALNHANFDNPRDASVGSPNFQSTVFGQTCCQAVAPPGTQTIIQTGESARVIQFALKLKF